MTDSPPNRGDTSAAPPVREQTIVCLWARCDRFPEPQFLTAVSGGLWESWDEEAERIFAESKEWFDGFGDDHHDWTYWTTHERIRPALPEPEGI